MGQQPIQRRQFVARGDDDNHVNCAPAEPTQRFLHIVVQRCLLELRLELRVRHRARDRGTLPLIMDFHPGMFGYYYRWSYKFDDEADFKPIFATVTHRYRVIDSYVPFLTFHYEPETLGSVNVGGTPNLFKIPDPSKDWIN